MSSDDDDFEKRAQVSEFCPHGYSEPESGCFECAHNEVLRLKLQIISLEGNLGHSVPSGVELREVADNCLAKFIAKELKAELERLSQSLFKQRGIEMSRFDYVKYDEMAQTDQDAFKQIFAELEDNVTARVKASRAQALVLTKLEEAYMWIGKAIRDDQIARNGSAPLQEERGAK